MTAAVPGAGDGVEDMGECLAEDEEQTGKPEANAALWMAATEKKE